MIFCRLSNLAKFLNWYGCCFKLENIYISTDCAAAVIFYGESVILELVGSEEGQRMYAKREHGVLLSKLNDTATDGPCALLIFFFPYHFVIVTVILCDCC